jgi:hypothetical protein
MDLIVSDNEINILIRGFKLLVLTPVCKLIVNYEWNIFSKNDLLKDRVTDLYKKDLKFDAETE